MSENQEDAAPMVYIVSQQPFDYRPAAGFGTLYFMKPFKLAPTLPGDAGSYNLAMLRQVRKDLQDYRPGVDFIIPTGPPSGLLVVGMILSQIGQSHKLLHWDSRQQRYNATELTV